MSLTTTPELVSTFKGQGRVLHAVRGWIDAGKLRAGEPLPTVRTVAESLDVDKGTVVRAMSVLQDTGVVRRAGRRLHVAEPQATVKDDVLADTILVVTGSDVRSEQHRRGWLAQIVEGLLGEAHERQCHTMLLHPDRVKAGLDRWVAARPLGVIMLGVERPHGPEVLELLERTGLPVVLYGNEFDAHGHDTVSPDHRQGTRDLTQWLIDRRCRRILRVWSHRSTTQKRPIWLGHRDEGFETAVTEAGLPLLPAVEYIRHDLSAIKDDHFDHRVREVAGRLVEHLVGREPVDAIVVPTDGMVPEVAAACRLFGKEPNKDVLIAGYDNDWGHAPHRDREPAPPAVTTDHDTVHLGQALMQTLLQRAKNPAAPPQRIALPPKVVATEHSSRAWHSCFVQS